ncbi:DUF4148 domain-containing protein [Paraburkholderia sp.]|uniref:DUF4148 domain-containing protein n=1 Tax=Paraburkholderia sp. TaxID=1926495 RepID=UPI0023820FF4|nr:DUF4148 domain-containing protein [Paraburkholderia sp.]MDE1184250.1 DUF4148 domain-containing protein [Paraburkholderia sp.]
MKNIFVCIALAATALATPAISFAQSSSEPVTRAEVRADLVRVEQAGYNVSRSDDANYPADIQAAEAKVAAQDDAVGGMPQKGTSESGAPAHVTKDAGCVGPVSYCTLYFGS